MSALWLSFYLWYAVVMKKRVFVWHPQSHVCDVVFPIVPVSEVKLSCRRGRTLKRTRRKQYLLQPHNPYNFSNVIENLQY